MTRIKNFLILMWVISTIFLPLSLISKLAFFCVVLYSLIHALSQNVTIKYLAAPVIIHLIFSYGLIISILQNNLTDITFQYYFFSLGLLAGIILQEDYRALSKSLIISSILFCLYSIAMAIETYYLRTAFLLDFLKNHNVVSLDQRDFGFGKMWYLRISTIPILIFSIYCVLNSTDYKVSHRRIIVSLFILTIMASSQRGLMLLAIFTLIFYSAFAGRQSKRVVYSSILVGALVGIIIVLLGYQGDASTAVRANDFTNFINAISKDWYAPFTGSGLGSVHLREGKGFYSVTENTYFDLIRYLGIPVTVIFIVFLIVPYRRIKVRNIHPSLCLGFTAFLVLSASNPTLLTSFGMIVVITYWASFQVERNVKTCV